MEVRCSSQQLQHLSELQKQLDASVASHQQRLKNPQNIDTNVNRVDLASFKLEWIFEKVNIFLFVCTQYQCIFPSIAFKLN